MRVPPALGALMAVSLLLSVTWAAGRSRAFQAPDEQYHFAYVQSLAERQALPGDATRPSFSTQMSEAMAAVNSDQVAAQIKVKPEWSDRREREWQAAQERSPRDDGGGPSPAAKYPPVVVSVDGARLRRRVRRHALRHAARRAFDVRALAAAHGPRHLAARRRGPRPTAPAPDGAAAVPALLPMVIFITSAVSPDGMLYAIWTLALWLGVRCVKRGVPSETALRSSRCRRSRVHDQGDELCAPRARGVRSGARVGGAMAVAPRSPSPLRRRRRRCRSAVTLGLGRRLPLGTDRSPPTSRVERLRRDRVSDRARVPLLPVAVLPAEAHADLPEPSGGFPLFDVWITQGWAAFGWLEVRFATWVYHVLAALTAATFLAAFVAVLRAWRRVDVRVVAFLALAFGALLGGLHWTDYHQLEAGAAGFMQGRYLFPVIGIFGLVLAGALSLVPARRRAIGDRHRRRRPARVPRRGTRTRARTLLCVAPSSRSSPPGCLALAARRHRARRADEPRLHARGQSGSAGGQARAW